MTSKEHRQQAADNLKGSVLAYCDPTRPVGDWSEWSAWGDGEQSMEELRNSAWKEVVELFEGDEVTARDWMTRPRIPLGHATPEEMLASPEDIVRLRRFIQQIQRGIVP